MIVETMIGWVSGMPPWLATFVLSMAPITESQATIPVAMTIWGMQPASAFVVAMLGNAIPFVPIFFGFTWVKKQAERFAPWSVVWFERAVHRVQGKMGPGYEKWGLLAVFLFVSIPFAGTGVWSGSLLAVILELKWQRAILPIYCGMIVNGLIVLMLTLAGRAIFSHGSVPF